MTDPIQHLRELMAQYRAACDDADDHDSRVHLVIGRDMDRALRNLAPQLLEVVESARERVRIEDMIDLYIECGPLEIGLGELQQKSINASERLHKALAALGGKGEG